jgi:hypothetical protein
MTSFWYAWRPLLFTPLQGQKASIQVHAAYLVIVSPPTVPSATSASATMRNIAKAGDVEGEVTKVSQILFSLSFCG